MKKTSANYTVNYIPIAAKADYIVCADDLVTCQYLVRTKSRLYPLSILQGLKYYGLGLERHCP